MSIRKQPFGYRMADGQWKWDEREAPLVREIFTRYAAGASFLALTHWLQGQGVAYDGNKVWNKNMVARILADRRYLGAPGCPSLIEEKLFDAAQQRRKSRQTRKIHSEAAHVLRRLCKSSVTGQMEQAVWNRLNHLTLHPELLRAPEQKSVCELQTVRLQRELDDELTKQPLHTEAAKQKIFELAARQYAQLGDQDYETRRMQATLSERQPMTLLEPELLEALVDEIQVAEMRLDILLKNGQRIGA